MSVDSGLCTVARLLTSIQKRANQSFALGMYALNSKSWAKSVVSNFRRSLRVASPRTFARARVYFARPTITIAKIRDYSQSMCVASAEIFSPGRYMLFISGYHFVNTYTSTVSLH